MSLAIEPEIWNFLNIATMLGPQFCKCSRISCQSGQLISQLSLIYMIIRYKNLFIFSAAAIELRVLTGHVWNVTLRTTDAFPVVTSLPPFGGREATTGTESAVRRLVEGGPNRCQQRRRVDAANECMMLPLEEFGHLPSQEVQEHCLQFQSLTDLLQ